MKKKIKNGFTLVELLAVITILGILALITVPTIQKIIAEQNKKILVNSMGGIVRTIKNESMDKLDSLLKYEYSNNTLKLVEKNGIVLSEEIEIESNGKIVDGEGIFYVYIDGDVEGNMYDGINCATIGKNAKEAVISDGDCESLVITTTATLIDDVVTSGDGLYLDELDNTYRYKGANPNNYVRLFEGAEGLFRIIAIEEQGIKVISNQRTYQIWDIGNVPVANCTNETCPRYTDSNKNYCSRAHTVYLEVDTYWGCNAWHNASGTYTNGNFSGTVNAESTILSYLKNDYYETYLKNLSDIIVQDTIWNIGGVASGDLETLLDYEDNATWEGKIGLINPSDYIRSQLPINNNTCVAGIYSVADCKNDNWIYFENKNQWTINAHALNTNYVTSMYKEGMLINFSAHNAQATHPVIYLKSNVAFNSGSGTEADPYVLAN